MCSRRRTHVRPFGRSRSVASVQPSVRRGEVHVDHVVAGFETLLVERRGAVEWITLNRPERLNAINGTLEKELAGRFEALADDRSARVVVLRGAGRAFCAG